MMRIPRVLVGLIAAVSVCLSAQANAEPSGLACIGNSITFHGRAPRIGWDGNWGMAATRDDRDYCSLLGKRLADGGYISQALPQRINDSGVERGEGDWAQSFRETVTPITSDYVVVFLGDNVPRTDTEGEAFAARLHGALGALGGHYRKGLIVVGTWWPRPELERVLKAEAVVVGARFVSLRALWSKAELKAGKERSIANAGVAIHPGDHGMSEIARVIATKIESGGRK